MVKRPNKLTIFVVLSAAVVTTALILWTSVRTKSAIPVKPSEASSQEVMTLGNAETESEYVSPDGKAKLILTSKSEGNITRQTVYFVLLEDNEEKVEIYTKDSSQNDFLVIPYNTFSPDNKYMFLEEKNDKDSKYMVFRVDGKNIRKDEKYITIEDKFSNKYPDLIVTNVTGWGGIGLLVVNTNTIDGSLGPSFWFDLSNFGFIRLANRFN